MGGSYPLPNGVSVVSRDRTASPADGAYNICYINGFQTQPGQLRWWKQHHGDVLLRDGGELVHDPGWPGEVLLDTRTDANRREIATVLGRWIDRCADDGFDAIEPDNLDSFTRSRHLLKRADALALSKRLANRSHAAGLAIAQKNTAGLTKAQAQHVGFDFAVAEECQVWHECGRYRASYGRHIIEIEYTDNGRRAFHQACEQHADDWSIVMRDRNLVGPSNPHYRFKMCG